MVHTHQRCWTWNKVQVLSSIKMEHKNVRSWLPSMSFSQDYIILLKTIIDGQIRILMRIIVEYGACNVDKYFFIWKKNTRGSKCLTLKSLLSRELNAVNHLFKILNLVGENNIIFWPLHILLNVRRLLTFVVVDDLYKIERKKIEN